MTDSIIITQVNPSTTITVEGSSVLVESQSASSVTVSQVGVQGPAAYVSGGEGIAGEVVSVYQAVVFIGGLAYKADPTNAAHAGKVVGMAVNSATIGQTVKYVSNGEVLHGTWVSGSLYHVGLSGNLSNTPKASGAAWQQLIGFAKTADSICINLASPIVLD